MTQTALLPRICVICNGVMADVVDLALAKRGLERLRNKHWDCISLQQYAARLDHTPPLAGSSDGDGVTATKGGRVGEAE